MGFHHFYWKCGNLCDVKNRHDKTAVEWTSKHRQDMSSSRWCNYSYPFENFGIFNLLYTPFLHHRAFDSINRHFPLFCICFAHKSYKPGNREALKFAILRNPITIWKGTYILTINNKKCHDYNSAQEKMIDFQVGCEHKPQWLPIMVSVQQAHIYFHANVLEY